MIKWAQKDLTEVVIEPAFQTPDLLLISSVCDPFSKLYHLTEPQFPHC